MSTNRRISVIGALVRDTFRQSFASRIFWIMILITGLSVLLCASVRIEGGNLIKLPDEIELSQADGTPLSSADMAKPGKMTLAFGAIPLGLFRDGLSMIQFLQALLAKWVAGAGGTLLALVWTAGFLPEFLQPNAASVLLAKPITRRLLLTGKCLGVLAFVAFHATVFVLGTWLALGLSTGYWDAGYLWAAPLLVLHFAIIYGASALIAVLTRNPSACLFGSLIFWLVCFAMNTARDSLLEIQASDPKAAKMGERVRPLVEVGYWILPKPADLVVILDDAIRGEEHFALQKELSQVKGRPEFRPTLSILSSLAFAAALIALSSRQFEETDY